MLGSPGSCFTGGSVFTATASRESVGCSAGITGGAGASCSSPGGGPIGGGVSNSANGFPFLLEDARERESPLAGVCFQFHQVPNHT